MASQSSSSAPAAGSAAATRPYLRSRIFWILAGLILLGAIAFHFLGYDLRSAALLMEFLDPHTNGIVVRLERHDVDVQEATLPTPGGDVRARVYTPRGIGSPTGMVVVHGIHHLGIDEPRLMNFAHAAASSGFVVLTPEISALADYHVDAASIGTIGYSAEWLQRKLGGGPVTIVGVSFAGGLSLLAARNPEFAPHIRALVLMGAYDSLARVCRFLATSEAELPDGRLEPYKAHDYGAAVYVYSHLDQFFPAGDLPVAHEALRDWLWERPDEARALLPKLSPAAAETIGILMARQIDRLRPKLLESIQRDGPQLLAISPQGKLADLHTPVFILHGATDDIIPSTESLWLEKEIPRADLRDALITPAFSHVDPDKHAMWKDELRLVEFLAGVLRTAG